VERHRSFFLSPLLTFFEMVTITPLSNDRNTYYCSTTQRLRSFLPLLLLLRAGQVVAASNHSRLDTHARVAQVVHQGITEGNGRR
jgi:hypothetical protein